MAPSEEKHYEVTLGEQFISNLKESPTSSKRNQNQNNNGFAIRYTVPPESLRADKSALNMRKTPRGEYIIENPNPPPKSDSQINANASFKGTGSSAKDTECVLIFNPQTKKYELELLGMDIQVSPLLKSRLRSQAPSSGTQSETNNVNTSTSQDRPAPSRQRSNSNSPVKNNPQGLDYGSTQSASHVLQPNASKIASGSLAPRSKTKAKLPTRKKITSSKPFSMPLRSESEADGESLEGSRAPTPSLVRPSRFSSVEPQSEPSNPLNPYADRNRNQRPYSVTAPAESKTNDLQTSGTEDDGFDDSFNNLADELADELGEDDDNEVDDIDGVKDENNNDKVPQKAAWSAGTAGNVLEDDDISSEEE